MSLRSPLEGPALQTVLDALDAVVYVCDMKTNEILYFNKKAESLFGPGLGRRCWEVLQKDQTGPCHFCSNPRLLDNAGQSAGVYQWELQNTMTQQWFDVHDVAIPWNDERMVRLEIAIDITDRKSSEQALEAAIERSQQSALNANVRQSYINALLDNFPYLAWLKDESGRFLAVNALFAEACGHTAGYEVVGKTDFECWPMELAQQYRFDDIAVMRDKERRIIEEPLFIGQDLRWFETFKAPIFDDENHVVGTAGFSRDITERRVAEQELRESEELYRTLVLQASDGIALIDLQTQLMVEINPAWCRIFGFERDEVINRPVYDFILDSPAQVRKYYTDILPKIGILKKEIRVFRHKNGSLVFVERTGNLIELRGKKMLMSILRDITTERRRQQEIERDLVLAGRVQQALLSNETSSPLLQIRTIYEPYQDVSGDLFHIHWLVPDKVCRGYLVDVTGHGLSAALQTAAMSVLLHEAARMRSTLPQQLEWLNNQAPNYLSEDAFAAVIAFEIDLDARQLRYAAAGIVQFYRHQKGRFSRIDTPSMFLGIGTHFEISSGSLPISRGDSFHFLTDGLSDFFKLPDLDLSDDFTGILKQLREYTRDPFRRDDASAISVNILDLPLRRRKIDVAATWPRSLHCHGLSELQLLRADLSPLLEQATGQKHSLVEVAVNEAIANALDIKDNLCRGHRIQLKINRFGKRLVIRVKTDRPSFAGNAMLRQMKMLPQSFFELMQQESAGRGLALMQSISHRMCYDSEGREVLLMWRL